MKLTTSLQKNAIFPLALAIMVTLGLFLRSRYTDHARERQIAAEEGLIMVLEFNTATSELLTGVESMTLNLWDAKYHSLRKFLDAGEAKGSLEQFTIHDIRNNLGTVRKALQELIDSGYIVATGQRRAVDVEEDKIYKRIASDLSRAQNSMVSSASVQSRTSRELVQMVEGLSNKLLLVFVSVFSMLMAGAAITNSQSALKRLQELREVVTRAANGDYKQQIGTVGANDEIGQTLRSVNTMLNQFDGLFKKVEGELHEVKKSTGSNKMAADAARESNMKLADALTRLKRAQGQIVQKERVHALEQIANGVTRDFNDVLTPILSTSDYLLAYPDQLSDRAELIDNLKKINASAKQARKLVRRLSAMFRAPESGLVRCVDINEVIRKAIEFTEPRWKSSENKEERRISCETALGAIPMVQAVEADILDAVIAMLMNAVEAMPNGGKLRISTLREDDTVVLEIRDEGEGMNDDIRSKAIEPFFSTKGKGHSGMGLATVLTAAGQYGGTVDIASQEGEYTAVTLKLPVCKDERVFKPAGKPRDVSNLKILAVDDDEWVLKIVEKCLISEGYSVETALNGKEALDKFGSGDFDLAILDLALPDMGGDEIALEIKKSKPNVPVILLTGFGDIMKDEGRLPKGVDLVLGKPVTMQELHDAITSVIQ